MGSGERLGCVFVWFLVVWASFYDVCCRVFW